MATTENGIYYPNDYNSIADIPEDMKKQAESVDVIIKDIKTKQNDTNNNVSKSTKQLQNENTELKAECKRLKSDNRAIAIVEEATGEVLNLVDSSSARFNEFEIEGNCEQTATLIQNGDEYDSPSFEHSSEIKAVGQDVNIFDINSAVPIVWNNSNQIENNEIKVVCASNAAAQFSIIRLFNIENFVGQTFTLEAEVKVSALNQSKIVLGLCNEDGSVRKSGNNTLTIPEELEGKTYLGIWLYGNNGGTAIAGDFVTYKNIKIVRGTQINGYSPFGQGSASFTVCNKNKFDISKYDEKTIGGVSLTKNNQEIILNGTNTSTTGANFEIGIDVTAIQDMNISIEKLSGTLTGGNVQIVFMSSSKVKTAEITPTTSKGTIALEKNLNYITARISVRPNAVCTNLRIGIQLEEGTTSSNYIPHEEQTKTIPIQKEFCKIGDYKDRFVKKDDKRYEEHVIKKIVLDGTENIMTFIGNGSYENYAYRIKINDVKAGTQVISNSFSNISYSEFYAGNILHKITSHRESDGNLYVGTNIETLDEFKAKLAELYEAGNPVTVYYVLSEPEYIECTEEQTAILDEIETELHTYQGGTHVFSTDEISPIFNVKYSADLKAYIVNQINPVTNAVLEIGGNMNV